uniref:uncharacterized protein LOC114588254 n=1 Tax=Podarcis muralis TaxID=64176 RepID=UPI00109FB16A|nr:uncharacterized protein LOC114588254 [Podarcis muralis]
MWPFNAARRGSLQTWKQDDSLASGHKKLLRRPNMKEAVGAQPLEIVGRGFGRQQQPSGEGKPGKIQRQEACKNEAPAPAPGTNIDKPSWRFPAVPDPCLPHPPAVPRAGMAPSWPYVAQKQQPRFPPIRNTSRVIPEPGETLAAASVPDRSGRSTDSRMEEFRVGQLIRSARRRFRLAAAASQEGLEPRQRPLASQGKAGSPLGLLPKPPPRK